MTTTNDTPSGQARKHGAAWPLLGIVLFFVGTGDTSAATRAAADCSSAAIQAAIDASSDGDTVTAPAGSCTWSTDVTIPNTKGIRLHGAGATSTIITTNGRSLFLRTSSARQPVQVSGFQFKRTELTTPIVITGTAQNWRINDNIFDENGVSGGYSIRIGADDCNVDSFTYGLIDRNQFTNRNYTTSIFVEWPRGSLDAATCGDWIWSQPAERGTAQAVYIEDNDFRGLGRASQVIDSRWGAKYVLRYNTIHNPWISTHSGCTNRGRDPVWTEVYKNTFTDDGNRYGGSQIEMRSTSGIWFGNTSAARLNQYVATIDHERSYRTDCPGPYGARCDGSRPFDENIPDAFGFRCLGQPGWGQPQASDMRAYTFQGVFAWENRHGGTLVPTTIKGAAPTSTHLQLGREVFTDSHIAVGPISKRPTTCTVGPVRSAYISNDENAQGVRLYVCTAPNVWTRHWEPYTYPHPLAGGQAAQPPAPPTGLKVTVR
jgi:hypothetical protein